MIHLSVDGFLPQRILIIASVMLLGRRTQQQIHLYWKDPIEQGDHYHQYFEPIDDIKLRQWFPEIEKILKDQHPDIYLLPPPSPDQPNPSVPTNKADYYLHLPINPILISPPNKSNQPIKPIFYREQPGIYMKSDYEKTLSKFVRKLRPLHKIVQQARSNERYVFRFPKKARIGIYLTVGKQYFSATEEVIKQILLEYPEDRFQVFFTSDIYYYQTEICRKFKRLKSYKEFRKTQDHFIDGRQLHVIDGYYLSTCQKIIAINLSDPPYLSWLRSHDQTLLQVIQITKD